MIGGEWRVMGMAGRCGSLAGRGLLPVRVAVTLVTAHDVLLRRAVEAGEVSRGRCCCL